MNSCGKYVYVVGVIENRIDMDDVMLDFVSIFEIFIKRREIVVLYWKGFEDKNMLR